MKSGQGTYLSPEVERSRAFASSSRTSSPRRKRSCSERGSSMKILLTGGGIRGECLPPLAAPQRARSYRLRQFARGQYRGRPRRPSPADRGGHRRDRSHWLALTEHRIEAVMHFAALASVPESIAILPPITRPTLSARRACSTRCGWPGCGRSSSAAPRRLTASNPRCPCGRNLPSFPKRHTGRRSSPPNGSSRTTHVPMDSATSCCAISTRAAPIPMDDMERIAGTRAT